MVALCTALEGKLVMDDIPFIFWDDDYYNKAMNQTQLQLYGTYSPLWVDDKLPVRYIHGLGAYVPVMVAEQLEI